jgi:hypothetical protein
LIVNTQRIEELLRNIGLFVARVALGYLFFTQLWWKVPPSFGCPTDFAFTTQVNGRLQTTSGLCDWIGRESVYAQQPRQFFVADLRAVGGPNLALDVSALARANGAFLDGLVKPNIRWFGYVVWGLEAFIVVSLLLGVLGRLGGLVALAQSAQLMIGLSGTPGEWEWIYHLMVTLSLVLAAIPAGRWLGVDAWLRPRLQAAAERGNRLADAALWLT